jgi:serine/threonine protein phosphatase PrpC
MVFCENCGNENRPGARFCRECGQALRVEAVENTPAVPSFSIPAAEPEWSRPELSDRIEQSSNPLNEAVGEAAGEAPAWAAPEEAGPAPEQGEQPLPVWEDAVPAVEETAVENTVPEPDLSSQSDWSIADDWVIKDAAQGESTSQVESASSGEVPSSDEVPSPDEVPSQAEDVSPEEAPLADQAGVPAGLAEPSLLDGTLVVNRYRVINQVETRAGGERVYQAEDMQACWSCGVLQQYPGLRYCEACGAVLSEWPLVALVETAQPAEPIVENGRFYHIEPLIQPEAAGQTAYLYLTAGQRTHPGMQRTVNEDSLLVFHLSALCESRPAPQISLFAVADGIGGSEAGEVASRVAVHAMAEAFSRRVVQPLLGGEMLLSESLGEHLKEIVLHANQMILEKRKEKNLDMGATLTALLLYGEDGVIANVGDSRTYIFREGKLAQITADHSVVASLVASGLIKPEEIYYHEQRNVILRSLGDRPELEVDIFPVKALPGDRFVLCCDGLWEMVRGSMIEDVLLEQPDPQAACNRLIQFANQAGGEDNISVVVVDVHSM